MFRLGTMAISYEPIWEKLEASLRDTECVDERHPPPLLRACGAMAALPLSAVAMTLLAAARTHDLLGVCGALRDGASPSAIGEEGSDRPHACLPAA